MAAVTDQAEWLGDMRHDLPDKLDIAPQPLLPKKLFRTRVQEFFLDY